MCSKDFLNAVKGEYLTEKRLGMKVKCHTAKFSHFSDIYSVCLDQTAPIYSMVETGCSTQ